MAPISPKQSPSTSISTDTNPDKKDGIWIGIDLGTSNCTAAVWSLSKSRAKQIRFSSQHASLTASGKGGRILPSALFYESSSKAVPVSVNNDSSPREERIDPSDPLVGKSALQAQLEEKRRGVLITSAKRIWGLTASQIKDEVKLDEAFLESCPFETHLDLIQNTCQMKIGDKDENDDITMDPLQAAQVLLETIRKQAQEYVESEKSLSPISRGESLKVRHCVIGVPAHFSRSRKQAIVQVAQKAGFDGHISTIVESTAAAMSYGLFVGQVQKQDGNDSKHILVLDMGGGTTDVTICKMMTDLEVDNEASFHVLTTEGNRHLGGDDMDEELVKIILQKHKGESDKDNTLNTSDMNTLRRKCRQAKEELCGSGKNDVPPSPKVTIDHDDMKLTISQDEFERAIKPIILKAESLVQNSLTSCDFGSRDIAEVVLVGGATRTPYLRSMLKSKFDGMELCTAISAEAAVAEGAAIQAAIRSELVPRHVLRNAMMLDALPHSIGVLVNGGEEEEYVPILERGMALPAMGHATFKLASINQKGVSITAVEDVGQDLPLERLGEFTFLLHRLSKSELETMQSTGRTVEVAMTIETSGKFIVSIFDFKDPEDLKKKERYQEWKMRQQEQEGTDEGGVNITKTPQLLTLGDTLHSNEPFGREEIWLIVIFVAVFGLYVATRLAFNEPELGPTIL
jgi:molecular chaperone DnaK (HSP70)